MTDAKTYLPPHMQHWAERLDEIRISSGLTPNEERLSAALSLLIKMAKEAQEKSWRCYHCDKVFTDPVLAAEHFGDDRNNPRPAKCEGMLAAIAENFERYGVHRNFHNAASVKILHDQMQTKLTAAEAERDALREEINELREIMFGRADLSQGGK